MNKLKLNELELNELELKIFTEQNALDYCQINNINPDDITELDLHSNILTDISGVKLFKNLKELNLSYNRELTDISVIQYLKNLKELNLHNNKIKNISVLKNLIKLKILDISSNPIKNISVIQYLTELKILDIGYLELKSDQIQYINSLNNLEELWCDYGFKDMSVLDQLKNTEIKFQDDDEYGY